MTSVPRSTLLLLAVIAFFAGPHAATAFTNPSDISSSSKFASLQQLRQDWADRSVSYYSKIMREERRRNTGELDQAIAASEEYQHDFQILAKKHYFALRKIKDGQYRQAEQIYKRIIHEVLNENEDDKCDHAKLAVTTLLLALHYQRMGDMKKTRSVFLSFFREVTMNQQNHDGDHHDDNDDGHHHPHCACSAKVLGAFALFEMKQGNAMKSLQIVRKAVEFDPLMEPVLNWKQFRDVRSRGSRFEENRKVGAELRP